MAITVRAARPEDAAAIVLLLRDLHADIAPEAVGRRIATLAATGTDAVFVACEPGRVLGVLALHLMHTLHLSGRIARITALAVAEETRRQGIGRNLMAHAAEHAERKGCTALELTTALGRADAQAFYRRLGFEATSLRFRRNL